MDKHLNGSASPEEEQELFEWYDRFQEKTGAGKTLSSAESDALLQKTKARISSRSRNHFIWPGIAASLVLILFSTWLIRKTDRPASLVNIVTQKDKKHHVILPDGTLVWLNGNSRLKYPVQFSKQRRELWLSGEGYFEVKHNSKWPFIVHTHNLDVKVLGTIFNLKAYPDAKTEASLLRGSVEVKVNHGAAQKIVLKPYQKLIAADLVKGRTKIQSIKVEVIAHDVDQAFIAETAWTQKAFSFTNETLGAITAKLEKVYGLKIIIQHPAYKEERFTGTFDNASLSTVLNALQFSNEFKYRKEGEETIIIY
ncbi:MAG: FecR domain-containing protein [Pedobacter sp.]|uniref:FecR family protein n=1 Tax=Pedobacter sp. TaxID=1411316 RepID=UPI0033956C7B